MVICPISFFDRLIGLVANRRMVDVFQLEHDL